MLVWPVEASNLAVEGTSSYAPCASRKAHDSAAPSPYVRGNTRDL